MYMCMCVCGRVCVQMAARGVDMSAHDALVRRTSSGFKVSIHAHGPSVHARVCVSVCLFLSRFMSILALHGN
jgi:hypothetical protein